MRKIIALLAALLFASPALAQSIQLGAGQVLGNSTTAQRPGRAENVTAIIDRALGSTRGALLERGASGWGLLLPGATAGQIIRSGGTGADPAYSTATYPATTTINQLLYSSAGNVIGGLATANSSILVTDSGGIPSLSTTLPAHTLGGTISGNAQQINNVVIGASTPLAGSFTSLAYSTTLTGTTTNANALAVGPSGATNPTFQVDASTASTATGIKVKGAAASSGVDLSAISNAAAENLTINAKGSGLITIGNTSTGAVAIGSSGRFTVDRSTGYTAIGTGPTGTEGMLVAVPDGVNQFKLRNTTGSTVGTALTQLSSGTFQFNNQDNAPIAFYTNNGSGEQFILGVSGSGFKIGASAPAPGAQGLGVGGQIVAAGAIQTTGANAGFLATDRASDTNNSWTIYSGSNSLRFFNSQAAADKVTFTKNTGDVAILSSTASSSTSTGALVVTGGIGVGGTVNVGGNINTTGSVLSQSGTLGVGYSTGAGSAGTQATSKSTTVTNFTKMTGTITMNGAALAAATIVTFAITGGAMAATDYIGVMHESVGTLGAYTVNCRATGAGTAACDVRNNTAGSLSEAIVLRLWVGKSVNS